jgi:outer membrane lipoprotein-sorting protein
LAPLAFVLALFVTQLSAAQQTSTSAVQRDPQAIAVISKALNAAGGVSALAAIQDFTGSGTVTYNWGDSPIQGNVTVKGRGLAQFRVDATLPEGMHSWVMNNGSALEKHHDGTVTSLPFPLTLRPANSTFPFSRLLTALQDTSWSISSVRTVEHGGQQGYDIGLQKMYTDGSDPSGFKSRATKTDFIIDINTFLVLSIQDKAYRKDGSPGDAPHEMQFSNYQSFNGVLVPSSITELISGQQTSTIELSQFTFNSGLGDSDFEL